MSAATARATAQAATTTTTSTQVQNTQTNSTHEGQANDASIATATTTTTTNAAPTANTNAIQQLTKISVMLEYDIDNTLNTLKEHKHCQKFVAAANSTAVEAPATHAPQTCALMQPLSVETKDMRTLNGSSSGGGNNSILPPTPPTTPNLQNTARKRWKILAKVLRKDSEETVSSSGEEFGDEHTASVRRFKSFDLLRQDSFEDHVSLSCLGKPENWYKYRVLLDNKGQQEYTVNIHQLERHLTASDLMGFNNTGNICVWPSEEALTAYVLSDLPAYNDKWILELGGGFTCLTGLMLAKYAKPYAMHLTDGNEVSVENVKKTVCLNELFCYTKCSVLKWEEAQARVPAEMGKFDVILSADCLFFDEARAALVDTIAYYLSGDGVALIMAPRRGKTMSLFIDETMAKGFSVEVIQRYNDTIWQRHLELMHSELYDEDLHYPVLLRLSKCPAGGKQSATSGPVAASDVK